MDVNSRKIFRPDRYQVQTGLKIMKTQIILGHPTMPAHAGAAWGFATLVLLIVFVALAACDSKNKEK